MGIRFRKSFKLAPGIRMNFGTSGASWTIGPKGSSIGIGKRGIYSNVGIPGTGISVRQRLDGGNSRPKRARSKSTISIPVDISVAEDGTIKLLNAEGQSLPDSFLKVAKRQHGDTIVGLMQSKCDQINSQIEALGQIHFYTPDPNTKPEYEVRSFEESPPIPPTIRTLSFWASLFPANRRKLERETEDANQQYSVALQEWQNRKSKHDAVEQRRKITVQSAIYKEVAAMDAFLEHNLRGIVWPRETIVSTEILEGGRVVFVDVDLPEIEDMPTKTAAVPQRGNKVSIKEMTESQVRRLYMNHIHGLGFRVIGEVFAAVPLAKKVYLSAFSQRANKSTGHTEDQYLYSVGVERDQWSRMNFNGLQSIDVVEALDAFELRRDMTKTGHFKPVNPFSPS